MAWSSRPDCKLPPGAGRLPAEKSATPDFRKISILSQKGGDYAVATIVKKRPGESDDSLIARFRRQVQSEKLLNLIKDVRVYKKPSEKKAEKMAPIRRAKKRRRK